MRLASHLHQSRHGIFYFRLVLPPNLRPYFGGRREIKRSLATRDPKVAKIWAYSLFADIQTALGTARDAMARKTKDGITLDNIGNLADLAGVPRFKVDIAKGIYEADPNIPDDAKNMQAFVQFLHQTNPDLLKVQPTAQPAADPNKTAKLIKQVAEATVKTIPQIGGSAKPILLSVAITEWMVDFPKTNKNTKTQASYGTVLRRFLEFTHDIILRDINADHIREFRAHRTSQGKSTATVDGDTRSISSFFSWAFKKGYYPSPKSPTEGLYALSRKQREKQANGAQRYSLEDLRKIFAPETYTTFNTRPHEYWLPLLALYTGARIEELAQLHLTDVYQLKGMPVLDINDLDDKHLKTPAAKRKLPIHPTLIELGFLDYHQDVKKTFPKAKRLFPYLPHTKHNRLSDRASKAFGRYLDALNMPGRDKVFHSFRDTVNNELTDRGVTLELRCVVVGHDINHVNVNQYRDPIPLARLHKECISHLLYERTEADGTLTKLDVSHLKYDKGQFTQRLLECEEEEQRRKARNADQAAVSEARQAREANQKRRPGRPAKAKTTEPESSEDANARIERLQAAQARAERNQQRRALKKQLTEQGKPNA